MRPRIADRARTSAASSRSRGTGRAARPTGARPPSTAGPRHDDSAQPPDEVSADTQPRLAGATRSLAREDRPMPTGRIRRTAAVGGIVGGQLARAYATKAVNLARSEEEAPPRCWGAEAGTRRSDAGAARAARVVSMPSGSRPMTAPGIRKSSRAASRAGQMNCRSHARPARRTNRRRSRGLFGPTRQHGPPDDGRSLVERSKSCYTV